MLIEIQILLKLDSNERLSTIWDISNNFVKIPKFGLLKLAMSLMKVKLKQRKSNDPQNKFDF